METSKLLAIWGYIGLISLLLIPFRPDSKLVLKDLFYLSFKSVFNFIATVILMYLMLPIALIDSISIIYRNWKE
jgi:hypothetical protein